jgi:hypothetical protein
MPAEPQTFDQWWEQNYADSNASGIDYTFGEEVWKAAQAAISDQEVNTDPIEIGLSGMTLDETEQIVRTIESRKGQLNK